MWWIVDISLVLGGYFAVNFLIVKIALTTFWTTRTTTWQKQVILGFASWVFTLHSPLYLLLVLETIRRGVTSRDCLVLSLCFLESQSFQLLWNNWSICFSKWRNSISRLMKVISCFGSLVSAKSSITTIQLMMIWSNGLKVISSSNGRMIKIKFSNWTKTTIFSCRFPKKSRINYITCSCSKTSFNIIRSFSYLKKDKGILSVIIIVGMISSTVSSWKSSSICLSLDVFLEKLFSMKS